MIIGLQSMETTLQNGEDVLRCDLSISLAVGASCSYVSLVESRKPVRCSFDQCDHVPPEKALNIAPSSTTNSYTLPGTYESQNIPSGTVSSTSLDPPEMVRI
jgi:hypothetical protein